jgi:IrrE N-terminal-like domain
MNAISVEKDGIPGPAAYRQSEMEPGRDAWDLVKQVWMTKGPGTIMLPVDPVAISYRLEIKVFDDDDLPPDVSGVVRKETEFRNPEIFLNEADSLDRQRFTCAHALGHYSRSVEIGKTGAWEFTEPRDFFASPIGDIEEVYATEFAAEMLMPRAVFREITELPSVASLSAMFGVTADVMRFRLDQIGRR